MEVAMVDNVTGNANLSANIFQAPQVSDTDPSRKSKPAKEDVSQEKSVNNDRMKKIAESVQEQINVMNSSLSFQAYGKDNDKIAIVVSDKITGKIIREIPAKEVQQMQAKLEELIGLIFNGSA
ncbi:MAG: flagellar protein FlaG [Smithellaceae bacterium]